MYKKRNEIHENATEARGATNVKGMTLVLGGSLTLVIIAFAVIWAVYLLCQLWTPGWVPCG